MPAHLERTTILLATCLVGCGAASTASVVPTSTSAAAPAPTPAATDESALDDNGNPVPVAAWSGPVSIAWTNIRHSAGCFYFSGPGELGRDVQLGESGALSTARSAVSLTFDGGPTFAGQPLGGATVLGASSLHEYGGTWRTRETITLSRSGDAWAGTYHYDEIDPSTAAVGRCHIDATLTIAPRTSSP